MIKIVSLALAPVAALAAAVSPATAAGAPAGPAFRVAIPIHDLALARPEGRAALLQRSRDMARETCAPKPFPNQYERESLRQCQAAFQSAVKAALVRSAAAGDEVAGTH